MQKTTMSSARTRPADEPQDRCIVYAILGVAKLLSAEFRRIASAYGLSDALAGTLWHVHRAGQIKAGDLARTIACDMGNLSGALDRLEESGLVERITSGADRRVRLMQLTAKGRRLAAGIEERFNESAIHEALGRLGERERSALETALGKLRSALATPAQGAAPMPQMRRLPA